MGHLRTFVATKVKLMYTVNDTAPFWTRLVTAPLQDTLANRK